MADAASKTEKPSPRRLEKARKEGQFLSSKDFVGGAQFVVFVALIAAYAESWMRDATFASILIFRQAFRADLANGDIIRLGQEALSRLLMPLAIGAAFVILVTFLFQFATTSFGFSVKKLSPSFKRLNPLSNLKELPKRNVPAAAQALAMMLIFGAAIYVVIEANLISLIGLPLAGLGSGLRVVGGILEDLLWKAAGVFVLFGLVDLGRQYRRRDKDLRMTKQELREESKESEGDPQIKARIQRLRRDLVRQQMMKEVPTATAVIVNPTHYAVALRYDHGASVAPVVVAKGRNFVALRIRELARSHDIPLVENPPLAQALYKSVKLGQEIPPQLYKAVAEVLAYVYRMMGRDAPTSTALARRAL